MQDLVEIEALRWNEPVLVRDELEDLIGSANLDQVRESLCFDNLASLHNIEVVELSPCGHFVVD